MKHDPREIEGVLRDARSGLQDKIVRNLGDFTVALLAISGHPEQIGLAGTGTLLVVGEGRFILTARHVWDEVLSTADHVGITLKADINHRFSMAREDIALYGLPKPDAWNEWGPDLALLRIPPEHIGAISAYRSFLNLASPRIINAEVLEVQVLMGTPAALGRLTEVHADLQITGMFLGPETARERDGFDYLDYEMDLSLSQVPRNFGGVGQVPIFL